MIAKLLRFALKQRFITLLIGLTSDRRRHLVVSTAENRGVSGYLRHAGRRDHALPGPRGRGSGAAGHGPHRARAEQRAQRDRAAVAHHFRTVGGGADVRLRHRRLLRAAGGAGKTARRRAAGRRDADARSAVHADRRVVPVYRRRRRARFDEVAGTAGLGDRDRASCRCRASPTSRRSAG